MNDDNWQPPEGMWKARCYECLYWFATNGPVICPSCRVKLRRLRRRAALQTPWHGTDAGRGVGRHGTSE